MIAMLVGFFTSSAGGALFRLLLNVVANRAEASDKAKKLELDREMARDEGLRKLHATELELELKQTQPVEERRKHEVTLFSLRFGWETITSRLPVAFRTRHGGILLGVLVVTYCAAVLALINAGSLPIATFDPNHEPTRIALAWGLISYGANQTTVAYVSAAGLGAWMCMPLIFIMTAWITGINRK